MVKQCPVFCTASSERGCVCVPRFHRQHALKYSVSSVAWKPTRGDLEYRLTKRDESSAFGALGSKSIMFYTSSSLMQR